MAEVGTTVSVFGSAVATALGLGGGGRGLRATFEQIISSARPRETEPEPELDQPILTPAEVGDILAPTIFADVRAAVLEYFEKFTDRTIEDILVDPAAMEAVAEVMDCLILRGDEPTEENIDRCIEEIEKGIAPILRVPETEGFGDVLARGTPPGTQVPVRLPGTAPGTGTQAPVIRPRDRTSPTAPEVRETGSPLPTVPGVFPPILDPMQPELDAPRRAPVREIELEPIDPGLFPERLPEIAPTAPQVELEPIETGLFPVRLPEVERLPPAPAPTRPSPATAPPTPTPAPSIPRVPAGLLGTVVGTITGAGIATTRRTPAARAPGRTPFPDPDILPAPEPAPQPLSRAVRERIDECQPCEKEEPEEPREVCVRGLYKEQVIGTDFIPWAEYDCITGDWIRDLR